MLAVKLMFLALLSVVTAAIILLATPLGVIALALSDPDY